MLQLIHGMLVVLGGRIARDPGEDLLWAGVDASKYGARTPRTQPHTTVPTIVPTSPNQQWSCVGSLARS